VNGGVPRRITRAWYGALIAFSGIAIGGAVAIFVDYVVLGAAMMLGAAFVTIVWNDWLRKRGFR